MFKEEEIHYLKILKDFSGCKGMSISFIQLMSTVSPIIQTRSKIHLWIPLSKWFKPVFMKDLFILFVLC